MGTADLVPGVSGGTVALVLGIYRQFVDNIYRGAKVLGRLPKGDVAGALAGFKTIEWDFLIPLGAGVGLAFLALRHAIEVLLVEQSEALAGAFCGLVAASIILAWRQIGNRDTLRLGIAVFVSVVAFILLGFASDAIAEPSKVQFFIGGAIAICAMILPGISGSFLLLMMGMYGAVLGGAPVDLLVFLCGAVLGLAMFSTLLNWMLDNHHDNVLAALVGLMVGSARVLWPWPNGVGFISDEEGETVSGTGLEIPSGGDAVVPILIAVAAFVLVMGVSTFAERRQPTTPAATAH